MFQLIQITHVTSMDSAIADEWFLWFWEGLGVERLDGIARCLMRASRCSSCLPNKGNFVWHHTSLDPDSLSRKLKSQSEVVFCLANGLCGLFCALVISDSAPHEIFLEKRVWVARLGWVVVSQFDSYGCRILRTLWTSHKRRCMLGVLKVVPLSIEG